jgi:type II secretory pathway pseudopilin PulG
MFKRRLSSAFTLIEAIIAIVILSVAMPPMLWAIRDSQTSRVSPILTSRARWLATEKLEDVIADRHSTTRGYSYVVSGNYAAEPTITGFPGFSRSVAITESGAAFVTGGTGYKLITVTVSWTDARAQSRSLALSTVVTDY